MTHNNRLDGPRLDALSKVRGEEKYAADLYSERFYRAGVKRAHTAHGRLGRVQTEAARALPGVVCVLTSRDIKGSNRTGLIINDQPVLVDEKIRHEGDAIALVVAETADALHAALDAISFEHEPLPGVFDTEEALREGTPLVHEAHETGNLLRAVTIGCGDADRAFDECDAVVEEVFRTSAQAHTCLETEAGWACVDEAGTLVITAGTQTPYRDVMEISRSLGVEPAKVRVIAPFLGGAFGGKDGITVQCLLGLAALHSGGAPVKMWWDRRESFLAGVKRMPARMYYRLGAKKDGTLHALSCRLYFDAGAYAGLTGEIMTMGAEHAASAYRIPNIRIEGKCVYTNNPPGGPFRGFGVPQVTAAMEQAMDTLAGRLSVDPAEFRRINALRRGDRNFLGVDLVHSTGFIECIDRIKEHPLWTEREVWKKAAPKWKVRGCGIGCMGHAIGYPAMVPDQANARVELKDDGTIRLYSGVADMGQGNAATYLRIAAAVLNQDPGTMELVNPDTNHGLPSGSSSASRTTYTFGNALIEAAMTLKNVIVASAAKKLGLTVDAVVLLPGAVEEADGGRRIALSEVAQVLTGDERSSKGYFRAPFDESTIPNIYMGAHVLFSYGAHLARIEVDTLTGRIDVVDYVAATDAGTVMNRCVYDQQVQGSIAQGIGFAVLEDYRVEKGHHETGTMATYIVPTAMDLPDTQSIAVEEKEDTGPFGMKGIGEIVISGALPAISNAFHDASGKRITSYPLSAERVLAALEGEGEVL